jgi:hypothetical protein
MKIKLGYIIFVFLALLCIRVFNQLRSEVFVMDDMVYDEINQLLNVDSGIVCILIPQKKYYRIGESPLIDIAIINMTDSAVYLAGCLDGSWNSVRMPYCDMRLINRKTRQKKHVDLLPNMLEAIDFQLLKPNEAFNPINRYYLQVDTLKSLHVSPRLQNYHSPPSLDGRNFLLPGRYDLQFVYSTNNCTATLHGWNTDERVQEILDRVPSIEIKSNVATLHYSLF